MAKFRNIQTSKRPYLFNIKHAPTNNSLKDLQIKYVIIPNYKATTNITFICRRFWTKILGKEPRLQNSDASNTYCRVFDSNTTLENKFSLNLSSADTGHIYQLVKLLKHSTGSRFNITALKCSFKALFEALTSISRVFSK